MDERIQGGTGLTMVLVFYLNRMLGAMGIGQCASTRVMAHPNECVGFTVCSNYCLSDGTQRHVVMQWDGEGRAACGGVRMEGSCQGESCVSLTM